MMYQDRLPMFSCLKPKLKQNPTLDLHMPKNQNKERAKLETSATIRHVASDAESNESAKEMLFPSQS